MLLAEMVVAVCIITMLLLTLVMFMVFSTRSFTTMFNYVELDDVNRIAMDQLTRDIRQCNGVTACSPSQLVMQDYDNFPLTYTYDPAARTLTRNKNGATRVILRQCDRMNFEICQRNTMSGSYDVYPAASPASAKVVNVAWLCSRTIFGRKENTESVQTARIVIRKQGT